METRTERGRPNGRTGRKQALFLLCVAALLATAALPAVRATLRRSARWSSVRTAVLSRGNRLLSTEGDREAASFAQRRPLKSPQALLLLLDAIPRGGRDGDLGYNAPSWADTSDGRKNVQYYGEDFEDRNDSVNRRGYATDPYDNDGDGDANSEDDYYLGRSDRRNAEYGQRRGYSYNTYQNTNNAGPVAAVRHKLQNGDRRIGTVLLGSGAVVTVFGISLFFNKQLMRLGNLLFIAGVPMTIGPGRTAGYFLQPQKARSTACLFLGILLVFVGWPIVGIALELFGLLNLFGNMFPFFFAVLKQIPVIGPVLNTVSGNNSAARKTRRSDDYYDAYKKDDDYRYNGRADDNVDDDDPYGYDDYNRRYY